MVVSLAKWPKVVLNTNLTFNQIVSRSCYYHITLLCQIHSSLDQTQLFPQHLP